jgi:outer membrane protein assembly factor BamD
MTEAYLSLGLATEAERIEQVAIYNYPQSVWTERLLELRDNPARELEAGWFERTAESVANIFD